MNADKSDAFSGFLCAGGEGKEESCYVRNKTTVDYKRTLIENNFILLHQMTRIPSIMTYSFLGCIRWRQPTSL